MTHLLTNLFGSKARRAASRSSTTARRTSPGLESLEQRSLMAGGLAALAPSYLPLGTVEVFRPGISFHSSTGSLGIVGSSAKDDIASVSVANGKVKVTLNHYEMVPLPMSNKVWKRIVLDQVAEYDLSQVTKIYFSGGAGNDEFTNDTAIQAFAKGGEGNDLLVGGSGLDTLEGEGGSDRLEGRGDSDLLVGGAGLDTLYGGGGHDTLLGGIGWGDQLFGEEGNDYLDGGEDGWGDNLVGGQGADTFKTDWVWFFGWDNYDHPEDFSATDGDDIIN